MTKKITILGLGAGDLAQLPYGIYKKLLETKHLFLRTKEHPVIAELENEGLIYRSFDDIYEKHGGFEEVYQEIAGILLQESQDKELVYAVPGHPMVAEKTVLLLLEQGREQGVEVSVAGGQSFLDPMFSALKIDPIEGFQMLDATAFHKDEIQLKHHVIICQVYDQFIASDIKLSLMEKLPDEYEVWIVTAAGSKEEQLKKVPLYELDRQTSLNNLTSVYIPPVREEELLYQEFPKLREVIAALRGPGGCPWDQKQTHASLKKYLLEEAYEVLEAIDEEDDDHLAEELGDVLLQVMLHAQIGEDEGMFTIDDVIKGITGKMIRRHPHVFGDAKADTAAEVVQNWEQIKKQEKGDEAFSSLLSGVPKSLPGLMRAYQYQKKAAKVGFDWKTIEPIWDKVYEEIDEFKQETANLNGNKNKAVAELGDLLFALVNIARFYEIDPEEAISMTNQKFQQRFQFIEEQVQKAGKEIENLPLEELDEIWEQAKKQGY